MNKRCIIITGPTASGKTLLAIKWAAHFSTSIISADSRQCYKELDIGVAKPSPGDLDLIPHYFINSHSIQEDVTAADFEKIALDAIGIIFKKNDVAILVGGTGLYIKAFCEGLDPIGQVDVSIRQHINDNYQQKGLQWLQEQVKEADPVFYTQCEIRNPRRLMRALEVKLSTGASITGFRSGQKKQRDFEIIKIGLELPRHELYDRINARVDEMLAHGLENEARQLFAYRHLNALQTVGYTELFAYFDGTISYDRAVELIKQNTRHYAKRQLTWFKKDPEIKWMALGEVKKTLTDYSDLHRNI